MSYSQYGGLGFRDGIRIDAASDAVITPDLDNIGTAGTWPGFGNAAEKMGMVDFDALRSRSVGGHVVIGDGPLLVALHKQTAMTVHMLENGAFTEIDLIAIAVDLPDGLVSDWGDGTLHLDSHALEQQGVTVRFEIEDAVIEYRITNSRGLVQHVRLTQADGPTWTAFSGSEIGAGHDEEDTAPVTLEHTIVFDD